MAVEKPNINHAGGIMTACRRALAKPGSQTLTLTAAMSFPTAERASAFTRPREALIDLVHLSRQSFGDAALEHEILRLYAVQGRFHLNRLLHGASATAREMAAHTLLGSSRGVGAHAAARILEAYRDGEASCDDVAAILEPTLDLAEALSAE